MARGLRGTALARRLPGPIWPSLRLRAEDVLKEPAHEEKNIRAIFRHGSGRSRRRGLLILEFHSGGVVSHRPGIGELRRQRHGNRPVLGPYRVQDLGPEARQRVQRLAQQPQGQAHPHLDQRRHHLAGHLDQGRRPTGRGRAQRHRHAHVHPQRLVPRPDQGDRQAAVRERAQPRSRGPRHLPGQGVRGAVLGRPLRALVQQEPVQAGGTEPGRPADHATRRSCPTRRRSTSWGTASTASRSPATARAASASPCSRASGPPTAT